jgi:hypothetical protein
MSSRRKSLCVSFLVVILSSLMAGQQQTASSAVVVPRLMNYSGKAIDATGALVPGAKNGGAIGATFAIYKDQYDGAPLWIETQSVTTDGKGNYTVQLGASRSEGVPLELFASGEARWLGVRINGGEEQPRVLLLSVPYALKAADAQTLGGLPASAFVLAAPLSSERPAADSTAVASSISPAAVTGTGTADYLPRWTNGTGTLGNSVLFQSGTGATARIGINTATPVSTLDVQGGTTVRGNLYLPTTGVASATTGKNSEPLSVAASVFNSSIGSAVNQTFRLQAEPVANDTASGTGSLNLLYGSGANAPAETGLKIAASGKISFAPGQTFPDTGSVSSVKSGLGLTGGPITQAGTLSIDTTVVPQLGAANTFTGNQTVNGNISASGTIGATGNIAAGGIITASGNIQSGKVVSAPYLFGATNSNAAAVVGQNSNAATNSSGVFGISYAQSGTTFGVIGQNDGDNEGGTLGAGVYGLMSYETSLTGGSISTRAGVQGDGGANGSFGVFGTTDNNAAGAFYNNGENGDGYTYTLVAVNLDGPPLYVTNDANGSGCWVDYDGDLNCTGSKNAVVPVDGGQHQVALSAIESPKNWFEDFGSEQLAKGAAVINLESRFAQTVNTEMEYHVFLTPNGDCKGLYIAAKTATSFEVRELGGGTSSVRFDYRIVALRKNFETIRLQDHTKDAAPIEAMKKSIHRSPLHDQTAGATKAGLTRLK